MGLPQIVKRQVPDAAKTAACGGIIEEIVERASAAPTPAPGCGTARNASVHDRPGRSFAGAALYSWTRIRNCRATRPLPQIGNARNAVWKCKECGEIIPGGMDVCLKCLANESDEKHADLAPVAFEKDESHHETDAELFSAAIQNRYQTPPADNVDAIDLVETASDEPSQFRCRNCGSASMIMQVL